MRDGLRAFAEVEVLPRHEANSDLFADQRRLYNEDGQFSDELLQLIGELRRRSKAGYYQMCRSISAAAGWGIWPISSAGRNSSACGPQNWLMLYAVSHWAGPSRMLEKVTEEARAECWRR